MRAKRAERQRAQAGGSSGGASGTLSFAGRSLPMGSVRKSLSVFPSVCLAVAATAAAAAATNTTARKPEQATRLERVKSEQMGERIAHTSNTMRLCHCCSRPAREGAHTHTQTHTHKAIILQAAALLPIGRPACARLLAAARSRARPGAQAERAGAEGRPNFYYHPKRADERATDRIDEMRTQLPALERASRRHRARRLDRSAQVQLGAFVRPARPGPVCGHDGPSLNYPRKFPIRTRRLIIFSAPAFFDSADRWQVLEVTAKVQ